MDFPRIFHGFSTPWIFVEAAGAADKKCGGGREPPPRISRPGSLGVSEMLDSKELDSNELGVLGYLLGVPMCGRSDGWKSRCNFPPAGGKVAPPVFYDGLGFPINGRPDGLSVPMSGRPDGLGVLDYLLGVPI